MFQLKSLSLNSNPLARGIDIKQVLRNLHGISGHGFSGHGFSGHGFSGHGFPESQIGLHCSRDLLSGKILSGCQIQAVRGIYGHSRIGNRDVVGYGINGSYNYKDDVHFPFPAVRFKENTQEIIALREKEKGDWKMLCCEEKKALYRASFCQTFSEFQHPTGTWKLILGWAMFCVSFTCWVHIFFHYYVWDEPLPRSFSPECQRAQLRRIIELHVNPVDGITSKWDYDNDCWKSQRPPTPEERMEHQGH